MKRIRNTAFNNNWQIIEKYSKVSLPGHGAVDRGRDLHDAGVLAQAGPTPLPRAGGQHPAGHPGDLLQEREARDRFSLQLHPRTLHDRGLCSKGLINIFVNSCLFISIMVQTCSTSFYEYFFHILFYSFLLLIMTWCHIYQPKIFFRLFKASNEMEAYTFTLGLLTDWLAH